MSMTIYLDIVDANKWVTTIPFDSSDRLQVKVSSCALGAKASAQGIST